MKVREPAQEPESVAGSPDGAALFFDRYTAAGPAIYRMPADGSSPPEQVVVAVGILENVADVDGVVSALLPVIRAVRPQRARLVFCV